MKKHLPVIKIALLAILLISVSSTYAQKKGKVHIKITDENKKVDTVIEFKGDIDEAELKSVIKTLAGEDFDVSVDKNGKHKMVWISDDDFKGDFNFDFDIDWETDSTVDYLFKGMKDYNTFKFDDLSDSMLTELNIKMDSMNNFIFTSDDHLGFHWKSGDILKDENVFILKGDSIFTNIDSLIKIKGNNDHVIIKSIDADEDVDELIMKMKCDKDKGGKYIIKTEVEIDDSDDAKKVKKVIIVSDGDADLEMYNSVIEDEEVIIEKDGKKKIIKVEIETNEEKDLE